MLTSEEHPDAFELLLNSVLAYTILFPVPEIPNRKFILLSDM
jgi:hypothetical protein